MHRGGTLLAGRYRVVRQIGAGGMGTVHLAHDETLGRDVAVKSVHAEPDSDHGRRMMREARLGAGLRHPHLVTVYDVLPEGAALLLVMEYVDGETLADALRRSALEPRRALEVVRAVADGLDHAHAKGTVHRDVKPANVLLGAAGAIKLADLGIATADHVTRITRTGGALGTVAYMAPEQFEPGKVTGAADVYALAACAYEALTGQRPYPGATAFEVFARLREGAKPPDVRELRPDLPAGVGEVLQRGLATDPAKRPASAGELAEELAAALDPEEERAPTARQPTVGPPSPATEPLPAAGHVPSPEPEPEPAAKPVRPPPPAPAARRTPARPGSSRPRRAALVPLAVLALAGLVLALLLTSGGDDDEPERAASPTTGTTTSPRTTQEPPARASTAPETPEDAVRAFYTRAAEGNLGGAWRLAGPRMRAAFGNSRPTFESDLGSLRAITFHRLEQTQATESEATVAIQTTAQHTDRTDRCTGTVQTVRNERGRWVVEPLGVSCDST